MISKRTCKGVAAKNMIKNLGKLTVGGKINRFSIRATGLHYDHQYRRFVRIITYEFLSVANTYDDTSKLFQKALILNELCIYI